MQRLTIWLSLAVYLIGGMLLPSTHVHAHGGSCESGEPHAHTHAVADSCCGHTHECAAEGEAKGEPSGSNQADVPKSDAEQTDVETTEGKQQYVPLTDVFGHEHDCPLCEFQNTAAQKTTGPVLTASLETLQSLLIPGDAFATCVDIAVPPLRGPPSSSV